MDNRTLLNLGNGRPSLPTISVESRNVDDSQKLRSLLYKWDLLSHIITVGLTSLFAVVSFMHGYHILGLLIVGLIIAPWLAGGIVEACCREVKYGLFCMVGLHMFVEFKFPTGGRLAAFEVRRISVLLSHFPLVNVFLAIFLSPTSSEYLVAHPNDIKSPGDWFSWFSLGCCILHILRIVWLKINFCWTTTAHLLPQHPLSVLRNKFFNKVSRTYATLQFIDTFSWCTLFVSLANGIVFQTLGPPVLLAAFWCSKDLIFSYTYTRHNMYDMLMGTIYSVMISPLDLIFIHSDFHPRLDMPIRSCVRSRNVFIIILLIISFFLSPSFRVKMTCVVALLLSIYGFTIIRSIYSRYVNKVRRMMMQQMGHSDDTDDFVSSLDRRRIGGSPDTHGRGGPVWPQALNVMRDLGPFDNPHLGIDGAPGVGVLQAADDSGFMNSRYGNTAMRNIASGGGTNMESRLLNNVSDDDDFIAGVEETTEEGNQTTIRRGSALRGGRFWGGRRGYSVLSNAGEETDETASGLDHQNNNNHNNNDHVNDGEANLIVANEGESHHQGAVGRVLRSLINSNVVSNLIPSNNSSNTNNYVSLSTNNVNHRLVTASNVDGIDANPGLSCHEEGNSTNEGNMNLSDDLYSIENNPKQQQVVVSNLILETAHNHQTCDRNDDLTATDDVVLLAGAVLEIGFDDDAIPECHFEDEIKISDEVLNNDNDRHFLVVWGGATLDHCQEESSILSNCGLNELENREMITNIDDVSDNDKVLFTDNHASSICNSFQQSLSLRCETEEEECDAEDEVMVSSSFNSINEEDQIDYKNNFKKGNDENDSNSLGLKQSSRLFSSHQSFNDKLVSIHEHHAFLINNFGPNSVSISNSGNSAISQHGELHSMPTSLEIMSELNDKCGSESPQINTINMFNNNGHHNTIV